MLSHRSGRSRRSPQTGLPPTDKAPFCLRGSSKTPFSLKPSTLESWMRWLLVTPQGATVLWLWVKPAILENDRVEDFSAVEAAPPREGGHPGTDLQIHKRLFHHQIVTAWASHDEVGFCRTPTHASPFEPTTRCLPNASDVARGTAEVLAWTDAAVHLLFLYTIKPMTRNAIITNANTKKALSKSAMATPFVRANKNSYGKIQRSIKGTKFGLSGVTASSCSIPTSWRIRGW